MKKISTKLTLSFLFLVILALLISGGGFFISYTWDLRHSETEGLREIAGDISSYIDKQRHPVSDPDFHVFLQQMSNYASVSIIIRDNKKKIVYETIPDLEEWYDFPPGAVFSEEDVFGKNDGAAEGRGDGKDLSDWYRSLFFVKRLEPGRVFNKRRFGEFRDFPAGAVEITIPSAGGRDYLLSLFRPQRISQELLWSAGRWFIVSALIALTASVLAGVFLGKRITRPIINLKNAALAMADGEYHVRAEYNGRDETADLAESFNILGSKLEKRIAELSEERDSLRKFLADASHELRTPLTSMLTSSEILSERLDLSNPRLASLHKQNHRSILRMKALVDRLLSLSRLQGGIQYMNFQECQLMEVVQAAMELLQSNMQFDIDPALPSAVVDRLSFIQVFRNCFENSLHAGAERVIVRGEEKAGQIVFAIIDDGSGISSEEQAQVTDRFYRGKGSEGSGLGLAIVKEIIGAHGGRLEIISPAAPSSSDQTSSDQLSSMAPSSSDQLERKGTEIRLFFPYDHFSER